MRDPGVDLVKAFCLLVVVGLHTMMAGVTVGADGVMITNALAGHPIFAWATWAVQVMPLFFLLGGFASIQHWRRMRENGARPADYVRERVNRLARPALLPIGIVLTTLATLAFAGVSGEVLREISYKIGQPLWFLAVYLGCSAFVPFLTRLHEAAPRLTLGGLLAAALTVDTVSVTLHLPAVSAFNFLLVWLFVQQLGFWYADGSFSRLPRWAMGVGALAAYGTLVFLTLVVGYSKDMYENLNPPTICILVLGVGQIFLVAFFNPQLQRFAALAPIRRAANAINRNSMTIYLWHVPVVVIIALTMLSAAMPMPAPLTRTWWETRPLFLLLVAIALIPVVLIIARLEKRTLGLAATPSHTHGALAALKVILSVTGVAIILVAGAIFAGSQWVIGWAIGLVLLGVAVFIGPPKVKALRPHRRQTMF